MILEDDQYEDTSAKVEITTAQKATIKAFIKSEVRKAGGRIELQDLMKRQRANGTAVPFWKNVTDTMWIEIAQECQAEWAAAKAAKLNEKA